MGRKYSRKSARATRDDAAVRLISFSANPPASNENREQGARSGMEAPKITSGTGLIERLPQSSFLLSVVASVLVSIPFILVIVTHAQYLVFANESLAYRYFACARIWEGDRRSVWLPQGQLLTVLQHGIWWLLNVLGIHELRTRLQSFGLATTFLITLLALALFVSVARSRILWWTDKVLIVFATLGPLYLFTPGYYYSASPDYYHLDVILGGMALALFLWQFRGAQLQPWKVGLFCGLLVANKVTLLALAAMCVAPILLPPVPWRSWFRNAGSLAGGALAGLLGVFLAFHGFDVFTMAALLPKWFDHVLAGARTEFLVEPALGDAPARLWVSGSMLGAHCSRARLSLPVPAGEGHAPAAFSVSGRCRHTVAATDWPDQETGK